MYNHILLIGTEFLLYINVNVHILKFTNIQKFSVNLIRNQQCD